MILRREVMNNVLIITSFLIGMTIIFQLSLAFGAPFGEATMGGRFTGRLPTGMRVFAVVQALILAAIELTVLIRAEFLLKDYYSLSKTGIWVIVGFFVLGSIMNMITRSKIERYIWAPVNIILLTSTALIALS